MIALEWSRSRRQVVKGAESKPGKAADFQRRFDLAAICLVIIVAYVAVMNWIGYAPATVAFLLFTGGMLTRWRLQSLPIVSAIALGFGLGTYWLFKFYFTVDLP